MNYILIFQDEIQLLVTGMALGLGEPKIIKLKRKAATTSKVDDELIFNLDDVNNSNAEPKVMPSFTPTGQQPTHTQSLKLRNKSPTRTRLNSIKLSRHVSYYYYYLYLIEKQLN